MNSGSFQGRVPPGGTGTTNSPRSPNLGKPQNNRTLAIAAGAAGVVVLAYYMMRQPPPPRGAESAGSPRQDGGGLKEDTGPRSLSQRIL